MKNFIVTTTINPPTKAIKLFDQMSDWRLIVIGDLTTPTDYRLERGTYVDPKEQERYDRALSDVLGWGCIQRRNFGILMALEQGAEIVALVDDDNVPLEGWGQDLLVGREVTVNYYETTLPAFESLAVTNHPHLWHRGFPIELVARRDYGRSEQRLFRADVQADLWNGDPDVDAVCRMEHDPICSFDASLFPVASNRPSPFNSQNTFFTRAALTNYFLFPGIGRMDDIWASYHVQALGVRVVYGKASVVQERNPHDFLTDLRNEYLGYEHNLRLISDLTVSTSAVLRYLPPKARVAFNLYQQHLRKITERSPRE